MKIIDAFNAAGQGQVFAFWDRLDAPARARLLAEAGEIDLAELGRLNATLLAGGPAALDLAGLEPAPYAALPEHGGAAVAWARARTAGEEALRAGRLALFR
jgi:UDP-N-acetylglucosamine/UDP-N-acetylgalactosamine diphosphorylase